MLVRNVLSARTDLEAGILSWELQRADAHDARPLQVTDIIFTSSVKMACLAYCSALAEWGGCALDTLLDISSFPPKLRRICDFDLGVQNSLPVNYNVSRAADEIPNSHSSRRGRLVGEAKVPANMSDVKRAKYSLSVQGQPDWCHFCKCYVQSHSNSKRNHEQSNAHKKNVELKMREIRKQKQNEGKEEEAKNRMMASIESAAAQAYKADLAAGARPEDAGKVPTLSAGARQRNEEEGAKKELEHAVETELKARAEAEYREKGAWKFDDRSNYYWHAKSSCYFDPKSGMFFDTKANVWSSQAPQNTPAPPAGPGQTAAPASTATERSAEGGHHPLGPSDVKKVSDTTTVTGKGGASGAGSVGTSGASGWAHAPKASAAVGAANSKSLTSMFNLGYGTNHPKYEAAKAKTHTSASRALDGAGGRSFEATNAKKLGVVTGRDDSGKRKRVDGGASGKKPKVSKEEAAALAKREAARERVEARTKKAFGLQ